MDFTTLCRIADKLQTSFIPGKLGASEVLCWETGRPSRGRFVVALRGDAQRIERYAFANDAQLPNPHHWLDISIQNALGIPARRAPGGYGVDGGLGQNLDDPDAHVSQVMDLIGACISNQMEGGPEGREWDSTGLVTAVLMPAQGTPLHTFYNAKRKKTLAGKAPDGLTTVTVNANGVNEVVKAVEFCTVAPIVHGSGQNEVAGGFAAPGSEFLVTHCLSLDNPAASGSRRPQLKDRIAHVNSCGGLLFPSLAVGDIPATVFGPVCLVAHPSVMLSGMAPYRGRGAWPVTTYNTDTWTQTASDFFGHAAHLLYLQLTGQWVMDLYTDPHFYVLGPRPAAGGPAGDTAKVVGTTSSLKTTLARRRKFWPRDLAKAAFEESRMRSDEHRYPYLEAKCNVTMAMDCFSAVVAPRSMKKVVDTFLAGVGFTGEALYLNAPYMDWATNASDDEACWKYAWAIRDALLATGRVLTVR